MCNKNHKTDLNTCKSKKKRFLFSWKCFEKRSRKEKLEFSTQNHFFTGTDLKFETSQIRNFHFLTQTAVK